VKEEMISSGGKNEEQGTVLCSYSPPYKPLFYNGVGWDFAEFTSLEWIKWKEARYNIITVK
jgi:hypothetical protein